MPLFEYCCPLGHTCEHYFAVERVAPQHVPCRVCGARALRLFPRAIPLQYFSESHGRVIDNLDPKRVIHSFREHERLMREKGVEPALDWHTSMKRTDGMKTTQPPPHPLANVRGKAHG